MSISKAFNLDCMSELPTMPDKLFSLGIPDPPYGLGQTIIKTKSRCRLANSTYKHEFDWDKAIPEDHFFTEIARVCNNTIIWGANYFPQLVGTVFKAPRRGEYSEFIRQYPTGWIIWDKVNGNSDFSDCELALTTFDRPTVIFPFMWAGMNQGKSVTEGRTMQGNKAKNERRIHPTQKPVMLYRWMFHNYTTIGDTVLDTHLGSGSSRIAAYQMGLDFVGFESSPAHFSDHQKRFLMFQSQLTIFNAS